MKQGTDRWLQRELLRRLLAPVLVIIVVTGAATAWGAHEVVEAVFDRWLLDSAHSLAAQVRYDGTRAVVQLSPQAEAMLRYDVVDRVSYEVRQGDRHVAGDGDLPLEGDDLDRFGAGEWAYDAQLRGQLVRIAAVQVQGPGATSLVLVAETQAKRDEATGAFLVVLAPVLALVLLAALAVGIAVRRTVRPLERIAAVWNERSHASLDPMPTQDLPRELRPFALALNDLLGRVRELVRRERHFASTAAHQLRTPLAGLQLGIARAAQCADLDGTRTALRGLETATLHTARLVQQLLSLARLDPEGRGSIELVPVDLETLAREVGEAYMDAAVERDIALELAPAHRQVTVRGEMDLLREAVGNLVDNAIRYTPRGGRIVLAIAHDPACLSVSDSGPGIRPEERAKVFERFVRGDGTVGNGSGLGLAIVREIAALHGAEVQLEPAAEGGARFTLLFPSPP